MANTVSPIYEMTIPEVTQDNNLWGGHLNADLAGSIPSSATGLDGIIAVPRILRVAPVVGASTNIVVSAGTYQKFTVNQVTTVTLSGWAADTTPGKWGQRVVLIITNGGAFAVTWSGTITWLAGVPPVMKVAGTDIIELFTVDNGVTVYGAHYSAVDALPANIVVTASILDANVTTPKLADASVTAVKAAAKEHAKVSMAGNQSILSGTNTAVIWDGTEFYDVGGLHDPASNPTRLIVPASWAGSEAEIVAQVAWGSMGSNSSSDVWIRKNGATELSRVHVDTGSGGGAPTQQVIAHDNAPALNDYYEIMVVQASGINENVLATKSWARLARLW